MIPHELQDEIKKSLSKKFNLQSSILNIQSVGGGCINHAHKVETNHGNFFLKWNDSKTFPGMFEAEANCLSLLHSTITLFIPVAIATGEASGKSFLLLEWVESERMQKNFWKDFGNKLALLHLHTSEKFGLDHENYIGSLLQTNKQHDSWSDFFITQRLEPQFKLARDSGKLTDRNIAHLEKLYTVLPEIFPEENPSLLHGDLWNGNFMVAHDGFACLIDPAVYYGHREMDLAMTRLFGGFDPEFYRAYDEAFPLEKNFESRIDICNLYPLLVHVNLFGGGYAQQVKSILSRF